jgi:hypothetical protein
MSNQQSVNIGSASGTTLLGVLFVGLKLTGYINWPWVWVLSPFWMPLAIVLALALLAFIVYAVASIGKK